MWRAVNVPAFLGATAAAATDVGYLIVIRRQGPPYDWERVGIVASVILVAAALVVAGALVHRRSVAHRCLLLGMAVLFGLAIVGMFSIGPALLLAALLTARGVNRADRSAARA